MSIIFTKQFSNFRVRFISNIYKFTWNYFVDKNCKLTIKVSTAVEEITLGIVKYSR